MKKHITCIDLFILTTINLFSQEINFTEAPENYQLYARDTSDSAQVFISGNVKGEPNFEQFTLKVFKDNVPFEKQIGNQNAIQGCY